MKGKLIDKYVSFIYAAIEGKYPGFKFKQISAAVRAAVHSCEDADDANSLRRMNLVVSTPEHDILNQVIALTFIERYREYPEFKNAPLQFIHELISGKDTKMSKRTTASVSDYPGELPTAIDEITARFDEVQGLVKILTSTPIVTIDVASYLLAHIFSSIIRIHFFADGNGRVARFTIQYLLTSWGFTLLALPKVRNDADWKHVVERAVNGETQDLALEIQHRLHQRE